MSPRPSAPPQPRPAKKRGSLLESSSSTDGPGFIVGRLGRPHGLDGFIGLYVEPEDLVYFEPGRRVLIDNSSYTVRAIRRADKGHQVAFDEVMDRDRAEEIRNSEVMVVERRKLDDGEFWPEQLIGLEVRPGGGQVTGVIHGPAQARLSVERDGIVFEVPFVEPLVPVVDLEGGYLEILEIEGLTEP